MENNPLLAGAALGVAGTVLVVFALVWAVDSRYVSHRLFKASLEGIQQQLDDIKGALGIGKPQ